ncbi:MAG: L-threonylcarbamoyladenylate synthase [Planctomycetota bacterium]
MPAVKIELQRAEDKRDVVHRVVEALSAGQIVALPTESVYGLACNALHPESVERLMNLKGRPKDKPFTVATKSLEDALDYAPNMPRIARRLARRIWPGPITLVVDASNPGSVIHRLDARVQEATIPSGTIGLRVPDHEVTNQIMRLSAGPMLLTSANLSGQPDATTGDQVMDSVGDLVDIVVDDGPTKHGKSSTVISVDDLGYKILREGILDAPMVESLTHFIALIVCTGNTCRSPMGEGLLRQRLAEKLGIDTDELKSRGFNVLSAGIAAVPGAPASPQAVDVMKRIGVDISDHQSQPITGQLAQFADLILTMTNGHRQALISHWPMLEPRTRLVRRDGADVSDPIGGSVELYDATAKQIDENLISWIEDLELS